MLWRSRLLFVAVSLATCNGKMAASGSDGGTQSSGDAATTSGAVPDDNFVAIPANGAFTFAKSLSSDQSGTIAVVALAMSKYEVTNTEYAAFVAASGHAAPSNWSGGAIPAGLEAHPVTFVSQSDAEAYCAWRTTQSSSWTYRLPTEAEWENAARGPNHYDYPWGNSASVSYDASTFTVSSPLNFYVLCAADALKSYGTQSTTMATVGGGTTTVVVDSILSIDASGRVSGWELDNDASGFITTTIFKTHYSVNGFTSPVGSFSAGVSTYGVYDLAGNVWEWTSSNITATNGAEMGQTEIAIRGGSWFAQLGSCATTYRGEGRAATGAFNNVGFRVVAVAK
jgi:formylglycine-generating enzyme required for sulfatase activity